MSSRLPRHAVLSVTGICIVLAAAVEAQQPRPLYDRYTEPIQIYKVGLGAFTKPESSSSFVGLIVLSKSPAPETCSEPETGIPASMLNPASK